MDQFLTLQHTYIYICMYACIYPSLSPFLSERMLRAGGVSALQHGAHLARKSPPPLKTRDGPPCGVAHIHTTHMDTHTHTHDLRRQQNRFGNRKGFKRCYSCALGGFKKALLRVPQKEVGKRSSITFFVSGTLLVTFSDASVTFFVTFLLNSFCRTPFAAG